MADGQTLTIEQMYALARKAGLPLVRAVTAAAIGMAESSGRTKVTSPNPDGGTNVGIWQLDTKGVGSGYTIAQLQDPLTNAKVMAKGSDNGQNWGDWATYASGAYGPFMYSAMNAAAAEQGAGNGWVDEVLKGIKGIGKDIGNVVTGAVGNVLALPAEVIGFLSALEQPVKAAMWLVNPANWARILAGVFGFFLLTAGLVAIGMSA